MASFFLGPDSTLDRRERTEFAEKETLAPGMVGDGRQTDDDSGSATLLAPSATARPMSKKARASAERLRQQQQQQASKERPRSSALSGIQKSRTIRNDEWVRKRIDQVRTFVKVVLGKQGQKIVTDDQGEMIVHLAEMAATQAQIAETTASSGINLAHVSSPNFWAFALAQETFARMNGNEWQTLSKAGTEKMSWSNFARLQDHYKAAPEDQTKQNGRKLVTHSLGYCRDPSSNKRNVMKKRLQCLNQLLVRGGDAGNGLRTGILQIYDAQTIELVLRNKSKGKEAKAVACSRWSKNGSRNRFTSA